MQATVVSASLYRDIKTRKLYLTCTLSINRNPRLGTTKYLEPKKEISPEDRLIVFKEGSISIQAPGQLKIRGLNNKSISDGTYATLQDGNLHIYESLSTSPPLLSIPISNAFVSLEESLQRLKLTLVEDKDVYYLKGNTDTQSQTTSESEAELEDWYCCLLEMSLRWGSVQKTDLEYEVAATRKKVGELWELQGEKNIKVQKVRLIAISYSVIHINSII